jgi:competence protein ComFC
MIRINYQEIGRITSGIVDDIISLFFPSICLACGRPSGHDRIICFDCRDKIRAIKKPYCIQCGYPLYADNSANFLASFVCGDCKIHKKLFNIASAACLYNDQARNLIHRYKFDGLTGISSFLGKLILQKYLYDDRLGGEDMIIAVPLHRTRLRERGFNQSELLAKYLSRYVSIPVAADVMFRIKNTDPLYEMTIEQRQKNLRGAFRIKDKSRIKDKTILVIDDIYTTGSTSYEVAKTLKKAGAMKVHILTVCRVLPSI